MKEKISYEKRIKNFLQNKNICNENREFFKKFFEYEEYKLKRNNDLNELDKGCYKTLYTYITLLNTVNKWFQNKPLKNITKKDFEKVYNGLEDGTIKTEKGTPYKDKNSFYNKIFKSKPFEMLGKQKIVKEVMQYGHHKNTEEVRYITEEEVRNIIETTTKPEHKLLIWLAFDIGENITAILQLKKKDCNKETNKTNNDYEYRINLRRETLKRSRTARSEITNYSETAKLLNAILNKIDDEEEQIFKFDYRNAFKILKRTIKITQTKCRPNGQVLTWKDLRSSMACDLLNKGWSRDEINSRLGHKPSSKEIDKYINFLAIDRHKPKQKIITFQAEKQQEQINQLIKESNLLKEEIKQQKIKNEIFNNLFRRQQTTHIDFLNIKQKLETIMKLRKINLTDEEKTILKKNKLKQFQKLKRN
ncbi:MAG: tyrosine-type recombinase/integrase [Nanoarchaeota archaeon]|nr:tyrosine-type recombinase/integrase [Nanoarchaeota archaeon]